jgi:hypothetical protein
MTPMDLYTNISNFELGLLDEEQTIELFQEMLDLGIVWKLQGGYGRMAQSLLDEGLIEYTAMTR